LSRRDAGVVIVLLAVLAILAGAVAAPSFVPAVASAPSPSPAPAVGHVEGVVGRPSSITPVTARTQVDRDLVALLFRGLVRLGEGTSVLPDLAERWTVEKKGARWTFRLREDAWWHDGTPVTAEDVAFTIAVLQHPDYSGALAATWAQVKAVALDPSTVRFDLGNPVGGFLQAATLPLLPAHLLADVPVAELGDSDFAQSPIGNGAFALVELTDDRALLEPVLPQVDEADAPLDEPGAGAAAIRTPHLASLELRFHDTPAELAAAFAAGDVDAAADLLPADAMALAASTADARALRYPTSTLTALAFNQRALKGPFADQRTRRALIAAIDREAMVARLLGGAGALASTPIPPSSWAYDEKAAPLVAFDRAAAAKGLRDAGWKRTDAKAWIAPGGSKPLEITLLAPDSAANPIVHETADRVAEAWTALGLATTVEALPPGEFVERLRTGDYAAAVVDVNLGLDPDPYAILGSSQSREGGSNVVGIQNVTLDAALLAARAPGTMEERTKAYGELQRLLGTLQPMPVLFFRDSVLVAGPDLAGAEVRPVADPGDRFWDVVRWRAGR
jgi:peptide/nickel transport system substrate-binding protein